MRRLAAAMGMTAALALGFSACGTGSGQSGWTANQVEHSVQSFVTDAGGQAANVTATPAGGNVWTVHVTFDNGQDITSKALASNGRVVTSFEVPQAVSSYYPANPLR